MKTWGSSGGVCTAKAQRRGAGRVQVGGGWVEVKIGDLSKMETI